MKYLLSTSKYVMLIFIIIALNYVYAIYAADEINTNMNTPKVTETTAKAKIIDYSNIHVVVNSNTDISLHSEASDNSTTITTLPNQYALNILGSKNEWAYLQDDKGNKGYIKVEDLMFKNGKKPDNSWISAKKGEDVISYAKKFIGTPYAWGGTNLNYGVDCSGYVYSVYKNFGVNLQRSSAAMYSTNGTTVDKSQLRAGDLLFFNTSGRGVSHVGMYVGDGKYIHSGNSGVAIANLNSAYSTRTYIGAKRIFV